MTSAEKLYDKLAAASRGLSRPLKRGEWIAVTDAFLKTLQKERRASAIAEGAEEIYEIYPKKVGKDEALKAITKALKSHPKEYLLAKTSQFAAAVALWPSSYRLFQDGGDRCPHPTTWFNQGRFQDDPKEWRRAGARGGPDSRPFTAAPEMTAEQKADQEAYVEKFRNMPEPAKDSFEHALWIEARRNDAVATATAAMTAPIKKLEHEQRLRDA